MLAKCHWPIYSKSINNKETTKDRIHQEIQTYCQTSNIKSTTVCNKIVDDSDVVGASPVGAAPTTSSFLTQYLASRNWAKTTARWDEKHLSFRNWCIRGLMVLHTLGPRFNIKMPSYLYKDSHYKDVMVITRSYLYNGNSFTVKTISVGHGFTGF